MFSRSMRRSLRNLIHGRTVILATVVTLVILSTVGYAATIRNDKTVAPASGAFFWKQIPYPLNPKKFVPSIVTGGKVLAIPASGTGSRTATWTVSGLSRGYWKLEFIFPQHPTNSKTLKLKYKRTFETVLQPFGTYTLNQSGSGNYVPSVRNITPSGQEFWIETNNTSQNNGRLTIQLHDLNCTSGSMIADSIRLTQVGTVKASSTTIPWRK